MTDNLVDHVTPARILLEGLHGPAAEPLWLVGVESPRLAMQAYGRPNDPQAMQDLAWFYACGLCVISRLLGRHPPEQVDVHLYLSQEALKNVAPGYRPACIDFATRSIHQMPWSTPGHEFAHLIAFDAFGGRSANRHWEEAVAECMTNPFGWPHFLVRERMTKPASWGFVQLTLEQGLMTTNSQRWIWGSVVAWMLERWGPACLSTVWPLPGRPLESLADITGQPEQTLIESWRQRMMLPVPQDPSLPARAGFSDDAMELIGRLRGVMTRLSPDRPPLDRLGSPRPAHVKEPSP